MPSKPISVLKATLSDSFDSLLNHTPKNPVWIPKTDFSTLAFWPLATDASIKMKSAIKLFLIQID